MSLLNAIGRIFAQPFVVTMSIVSGGVLTAVRRGNAPAPRADFLSLKGMPERVVTLLDLQPEARPGEYRLPFLVAKRLIKELRDPALANLVKLEIAAVEALQPVAVPSDFRV